MSVELVTNFNITFFHNVITHNRGTNPVTIMLYYPWWHDGPTKLDLLPTVMAS